MKTKTLTYNRVEKLGLNKVSVITADMLDGYTSIGNGAFSACTGLTSITIPNSVTSIGNYAFDYCSSLTSVTIPNSVTSIGSWAFCNCHRLTSVTIPNGVISIGEWVFEACTGLTSITIPNSVTSIGNYAFDYCSSLTSVTIPNSVTSIGSGAFCNCHRLTSVTIPNGVTSIRHDAFDYCISLTSVTIGDKTYKNQVIKNGKCKAYKGFNADMTCRHFQYKEGKTFNLKGKPILCRQGFHACLNLHDVFKYYCGKIGEDFCLYEVELEGVIDERHYGESKVVAKKITIGKRIL